MHLESSNQIFVDVMENSIKFSKLTKLTRKERRRRNSLLDIVVILTSIQLSKV
jgi:hypothetical protein